MNDSASSSPSADSSATGCYLMAPLPANEAQRLKALHSYGVLDTAAEQAFDGIAKLAAICCEVPIALISLVDRDRQWFKSHLGLDTAGTLRGISFCAHAILTPERLMEVPDARQDERFAQNPLVLGDPHIVFYAGAPLVTPTGEAIGTLCIIDHEPRQLTDLQRRMLSGLAAQAVTQLELRRSVMTLEQAIDSQARYVEQLEHAQQALEHESSTDVLTGVGNRRAFDERLDTELAKSAQQGDMVALAILDVDFFKRYNDTFGHPAGDAVLKQLAGLMKESCRNYDFPARVGGEEFAIILPGITRESALVIAERLRRSVQRAVWPNRQVTISVGVALAQPDDGAPDLAERADIALYRSKRDGRNRVTMATEEAAA
jgi:diguanylate cyclase (GGDEF)-like protein